MKVDMLIFPVDFIVLDMKEDREISLILGRPFLAIRRPLINVQERKFQLQVQDKKVTFNIFGEPSSLLRLIPISKWRLLMMQ